ncbi:hypothetical protein AHiyo4_47290 [Arthrobacter sp. Hiyo4]|nr:hypothetical protein AHiyo4_47290 [Arthrobacter sp. Hiyo4]
MVTPHSFRGAGSRLGRSPAPDLPGLRPAPARPALLFLVSVLASMTGLAIAMQSIPTGTAYAVWVGVAWC